MAPVTVVAAVVVLAPAVPPAVVGDVVAELVVTTVPVLGLRGVVVAPRLAVPVVRARRDDGAEESYSADGSGNPGALS